MCKCDCEWIFMRDNENKWKHGAQCTIQFSKIAFAILTRNRVLVVLRLFWSEGKVIFIILLILLSGWFLNVVLKICTFLAPSGAQGFTMSVRLSVPLSWVLNSSSVSPWSVLFLS